VSPAALKSCLRFPAPVGANCCASERTGSGPARRRQCRRRSHPPRDLAPAVVVAASSPLLGVFARDAAWAGSTAETNPTP
jgi:hypothetical protein